MALSATAQRELGYASESGASNFWTSIIEEDLPEMRWPQTVETADRMRRQDAQVASVLRAVTAPIIRTGWYLDGTGASDEVNRRCSHSLGLPLRGEEPGAGSNLRGRDRFSWSTHIRLALTFLPFGHSVFEQLYRIDPDGFASLRKLGFRPQRSIAKWNIARDGGLVSIEQKAPTGALAIRNGSSGPVLPINRLVVYSWDREGGNWWGRSLLRPAYKNWLLKDDALRTWDVALQRNGMGIPVVTAGTNDQTDITAAARLAQRIRAGDHSGLGVGKDGKAELMGVTGGTVDADKFVRYQDEQIARAVLAHFLNLGTQTGSWALGQTLSDFFTLSLQIVAEELQTTANAHIVEDLVDINFGPNVPAPRIVFDEIGSRRAIDSELATIRHAAGLDDDRDMARFIEEKVAA